MNHLYQIQLPERVQVDQIDQVNLVARGANAPKILLVKLSSLGDVLHNLPIIWDLRKRLPNAQIDWIVEEAYVHLLEPLKSTSNFKGIDHIIPIAFRRWRKNLFSIHAWREFFAMRKLLRKTTYDVVLETQGLLKSALVCALAKKSDASIVAGLGNATEHSGYEPIAQMFYTQLVHVPVKCHAVDRSRQIMCSAFNWPVFKREEDPPLFYPAHIIEQLSALPITVFEKIEDDSLKPYVVCFHCTARAAKRWPKEYWIELGNALSNRGYRLLFPWGNNVELKVSQMIASEIQGAIVPRAISIQEAYRLIAHATLTVGVDTGLTHLAATLGMPTVEIYCDSPRWKTEGYWSNKISNHGDIKKIPNVEEVLQACANLIKNEKKAYS
jgi:heptosyltransferase-1